MFRIRLQCDTKLLRGVLTYTGEDDAVTKAVKFSCFHLGSDRVCGDV